MDTYSDFWVFVSRASIPEFIKIYKLTFYKRLFINVPRHSIPRFNMIKLSIKIPYFPMCVKVWLCTFF